MSWRGWKIRERRGIGIETLHRTNRYNSNALRVTLETASALVDQALFAGTSLLVNVLLARWLSMDDYGAFVLLYSFFLIIEGVHRTVIVHPILIFGAGKHQANFRSYLASMIGIHLALSFVVAVTLVAASQVLDGVGMGHLGRSIAALAVGGPFMLLMWMLRRALYAISGSHFAALGGLAYLLLSLAMFSGARYLGSLSVTLAFVILGAAAAGVSIILIGILRPDWRQHDRDYKGILLDHWSYGRWAAPATLLQWIPMNAYFSFLSLFHALDAAGILKATVNMVQPMLHSLYAGGLLLIPRFARSLVSGAREEFRRDLSRSLLLSLGSCAVFFVLLVVFGERLMIWVYGEQYAVPRAVLAALGLCPFFVALDVVFGAVLRAANRSKRIFWSHAAGALFTVLVGAPLTRNLGLIGGVAGLTSSLLGVGVAVAFSYFAEKRSLFPR